MLEKIVEIVKRAGEIYKGAGDDLGVQEKGSAVNLVTKYDKMIQDFLVEEFPRRVFLTRRARATTFLQTATAL